MAVFIYLYGLLDESFGIIFFFMFSHDISKNDIINVQKQPNINSYRLVDSHLFFVNYIDYTIRKEI